MRDRSVLDGTVLVLTLLNSWGINRILFTFLTYKIGDSRGLIPGDGATVDNFRLQGVGVQRFLFCTNSCVSIVDLGFPMMFVNHSVIQSRVGEFEVFLGRDYLSSKT